MSSIASYPERCNFETSLCGWSQEKSGDNFDWQIGVADVVAHSAATGPTRDHTKGRSRSN